MVDNLTQLPPSHIVVFFDGYSDVAIELFMRICIEEQLRQQQV